jgi:hypothetical protein
LRGTRGSNHATPNVSGVSSNDSTSHPFVWRRRGYFLK